MLKNGQMFIKNLAVRPFFKIMDERVKEVVRAFVFQYLVYFVKQADFPETVPML